MSISNKAWCIAVLSTVLLSIQSISMASTWYVKWDSPGPTFDGRTWSTAYHTIQEGIDAASSGDEVWVAQGTYSGLTGSGTSDSFEALDSNSVDILGREEDLYYQYPYPSQKLCHLTVLYPTGSLTESPGDLVLTPSTNQSSFTYRLQRLLANQTVLVFANHPSFQTQTDDMRIAQDDLKDAANATVLDAMEISRGSIEQSDRDKWDYVLANLDDQGGDCTKILWALCADDNHSASTVNYPSTGAMMGLIETATANSNRRDALKKMIEAGSFVALPPGLPSEVPRNMPVYVLNASGDGTAGSIQVTVFVDNISGGSASLWFVGCDYQTGNTQGSLLYSAGLTLETSNTVTYYLTTTGNFGDPELSVQQKANIKYIRPQIVWSNGSRAYLQPVRIKSDAHWWSKNPYPAAQTGKTVTYFNTHAHTMASDGDTTPACMREKYWTNYGQIDSNKPRFGIITDHNIPALFSPFDPVTQTGTKSVVTLKEGVHVYGGFAGGETQRSQRNWVANPTIIDGIDGGNQGRSVYADGSAWTNKSNATLDGFKIRNGKALNGNGGGMWLRDCSAAVGNCVFGDQQGTQNRNKGTFGAGLCISVGSPTIANCAFANNGPNDADGCSRGGGILTELYGAPTITNCTFKENRTTGRNGMGGGICNSACSSTIDRCLFEKNYGYGYGYYTGGGGVCNRGGATPIILNSVFLANEAKDGTNAGIGGAVSCVFGSSMDIRNSTMQSNTAQGNGGAIYSSSPFTVSNSVMVNNTAQGANQGQGGGAIYSSSSFTVWNSTMVYNMAQGEGGAVYSSSQFTMSNSVVVKNSSPGLRNTSTTAATLTNDDLWSNGTQDYVGSFDTYDCISAEPEFVRRDDQAKTGDFHLKPNSPCIDEGTNTAAPVIDNEGYLRPQDGDTDGTLVCDMGAYEYPLSAGIVKSGYTDDTEVAFGGVSVTGSFPSEERTYVENLARNAGIRLQTSQSFDLGDVLNLSGTMQTDSSTNERYVQLSGTPQVVRKGQPVTPLSLINRSVGGATIGYQPGVAGSADLNNLDLRVKLWGRTAYAETDYFYVDDGSALNDGSGHIGIRILSNGLSIPGEGDYVVVTGISSLYNTGTDLRPVVWATSIEQNYGAQGGGMASGPEGGFAPGPESSGPESLGPEEGSIEYALAQPDGSHVSVRAVQIASHGSGSFILREIVDPAIHPTVLVESVKSVNNGWIVDVEGIIYTRSTGERAIDDLQVLLYTDPQGRAAPPSPMISVSRGADWLWKIVLP